MNSANDVIPSRSVPLEGTSGNQRAMHETLPRNLGETQTCSSFFSSFPPSGSACSSRSAVKGWLFSSHYCNLMPVSQTHHP
ncbi:hypothetical protein E2C01_076154 [Portunus trituberculatus]|uniref:Uncharacterized protein n=1 Tax=Portunus trituberculatus TaxID=210409 RepID=A0A5B7ICH1_PORTR|nr:hypothetical protein [Portunus trituberculatus]